MADVKKFETANRAGGRQFVAHGVYAAGNGPYSIWFSDAPALVDAERKRRDGKTLGVKRSWLAWKALERQIPRLIAQWERENGK